MGGGGDPAPAHAKWQRVLDDILRFPRRIDEYRTSLETAPSSAAAIASQFPQSGEDFADHDIHSLDVLDREAPELMKMLRITLATAMNAAARGALGSLDIRFLYPGPNHPPTAFEVRAVIDGGQVSCTIPIPQDAAAIRAMRSRVSI